MNNNARHGSHFFNRHRHKDLLGRAVFMSRSYKLMKPEAAVVLAYHSISDVHSPLTCPPSAFEKQCRFFAKYCDVVPVSEMLNLIRSGSALLGKLSITFDDGYKDNFELAAESLSKHGLPATFFVATEFIDSDHIPWWDKDKGIQSRWMTWQDVKALSDAGFSIGGHTQNHIDLGTVSLEEAKKEILGCFDTLRDKLGIDCNEFAYPYGGKKNIRPASLEIIRDSKFESCFSAYGGKVNPADDQYALRRQPIDSWHISEYHLGASLLSELSA
jgi:peptidoglycan/xylan/chitin deacetylase (PgdA/CDA1 family)